MILSLGDRQPVFQGDQHFVAASADVIGSVVLAPGVSVWFNAVLRGDNDIIEVGADSNIQDGAILHTDPGIRLQIGSHVSVGHGAILHGCDIGDHTLIGIGSRVLNNARIGANCLLGAHSLVTEGKAYPDGVLLAGSPAKVFRPLTDAEIDLIKKTAESYVEKSACYLAELSADFNH